MQEGECRSEYGEGIVLGKVDITLTTRIRHTIVVSMFEKRNRGIRDTDIRDRSFPPLFPLTFFFELLAALHFSSLREEMVYFNQFRVQFFGLLLLFVLLRIGFWGVTRNLVRIILFYFLLLVYILIGYPMGPDIGIELLLQSVLIITICFGFTSVPRVIFLLQIIIVSILFQRDDTVWNSPLLRPEYAKLAELIIVATGTFLLTHFMVLYRERDRLSRRRIEQLNTTVNQLLTANVGFQRYASSIQSTSILQERNRLSRDIHDTIGYTLMNLIMMLEAAQDLIGRDPEELRRLLLRIVEQCKDGFKETRRALHALRQESVEVVRGLRAIRKLVEGFQLATAIMVEVEYGNMPWTMSEEVEVALYRLLQEGMTNAFRHGKATRINIGFWRDTSELIVTVRDNGSGSPEIVQGIGIAGMRERIEEMGGVVIAHNVVDGFEISARIPYYDSGNAL